jgi:hypothetical protein
MSRKPKQLVLTRLYCPSHCMLSFCCYQAWLVNNEEWSRGSNTKSACLYSQFFPTNLVFEKQILLDGVVYTRQSRHHLTESQFVAHRINLLYLSHDSTFELCTFLALPNKDDIISHLVHI